MRIGEVRSGLVEARHEVSVVAATPDGVVAAFNERDDRFFLRSAAKPFQTRVSQLAGADLGLEQVAVASGSHSGRPVHVAHVRKMLAEVGLDESHLLCPPSRPSSIDADRAVAATGDVEAQRIFHNCSGKHAAMLRACLANDWPLSYTDENHPLQQQVLAYIGEVTGCDPTPVGIDGCGVPTLRSTTRALARGFAVLAIDPDLEEVRTGMYRYSSLTADGARGDSELSRWVPATVKIGAMGCVGVAHQNGIGIAAKCWSGRLEMALMGVVAMLGHLGLLPDYPAQRLAAVANPPVLGGGEPVGTFEFLDE